MRMLYFLLFFLLTYGSLHAYAYVRVNRAFGLRRKKVALALFMVLMVAAPVLVRLAERAGIELLARLFSYLGYIWMGGLFFFVATALVVDLVRCIIAVGGKLSGKRDHFRISARTAFFVPLVVSVAVTLFGYFEAAAIRTEYITIQTAKLPAAMDRFRIVQISDVHLGLIVRHKRLASILAAVKQAGPDLLVSTGDLVDGQINDLTGLAEMLAEIKPPYGKFAVTGNHEYYAGISQALDFTRQAGFALLHGESQTIDGFLTVAGIDDRAGVMMEQAGEIAEKEVLQGLPPDNFILFLKHRPRIDQEAMGRFDLQLSGHTHKGQIFPFGLVTWLYYPVDAGMLSRQDGSLLYVSRGSGTWGPPIRFLAPPEITVIDLVREKTD